MVSTSPITSTSNRPPPPLGRRVRTALGALSVLARDHGRLDQVLVFTQAVNAKALVRGVERFSATPEGARLLEEQPRIDRAHVDYDALRALPDGTLGREYVRFLDRNGIGPEPFTALPKGVDARVAYLMLRLRQTHDLWHVVTEYEADVPGELLLQAFTHAQTGAPASLLLVVFGTLRYVRPGQGFLRALRNAAARGKATKPLPTFRWEEHWSVPVVELRRMLACPPLTSSN